MNSYPETFRLVMLCINKWCGAAALNFEACMELYLKKDRKVIKIKYSEKLDSGHLQIRIEISIANLSKLIEHFIKYK